MSRRALSLRFWRDRRTKAVPKHWFENVATPDWPQHAFHQDPTAAAAREDDDRPQAWRIGERLANRAHHVHPNAAKSSDRRCAEGLDYATIEQLRRGPRDHTLIVTSSQFIRNFGERRVTKHIRMADDFWIVIHQIRKSHAGQDLNSKDLLDTILRTCRNQRSLPFRYSEPRYHTCVLRLSRAVRPAEYR